MTYFKTYWLFLGLFIGVSSIIAQSSITTISQLTHSVGQYQKWEAKVFIANPNFTNPYDYTQVCLTSVFTSPSGQTKTIEGFWKDGYNVSNLTTGLLAKNAAENGWYIRFTPTEVGTWTYSMTFTDLQGTSSAQTGSFQCSASSEKGFIRRQEEKNYLKFDNGSPYVPIGQNLCWYDHRGIGDLKTWMDPMSDNKANYIRYWLCYWATELEWSPTTFNYPYIGLKQYEQSHAYELDWLIDYAKQKGLYIDFCIQNHGQLQKTGGLGNDSPQWETNPYNTALGGPCGSPAEYWSNPIAKATYKNKLRYLVARWGYSTNIMAWEFFDEMDLTEDYKNNIVNATNWVNEMAEHLKTIDPNQHLTTNSYTYTDAGANVFFNNNIDISQVHYYDGIDSNKPPTNANYETIIATQAKTMTEKYNKPFMTGEFGLFVNDQVGNTAIYDAEAVMMHNIMWSTMLNGSMGPGATWWWSSYTHPFGAKTYKIFKQLADFTTTHMDVAAKNYKPITPIFTSPGNFQTAIITPQYAGYHPPTYDAAPAPSNKFTISSDGSLFPVPTNLSNVLFGGYHPWAINPPTFEVNFPVAGEFKVLVTSRGVTSTSTLVITVDGVVALTKNDPSNASYSVNISAGKHTIKVENTANEWIEIGSFTCTNYIPGGVPIIGNALRDSNHVVGWMHNRDYNWQYLKNNNNIPPPTLSNASMNLSGMTPNQRFTIQFFSTTTNEVLSTVNATSNVAGLLIVPLPSVAWDMSFRVEAALPNGIKTVFDSPSVFSLLVYPNPTNEDVIVHFELKKNETLTTTLTDICGRVLQSSRKYFSEGTHDFVMPTHTLGQGVYILTMRTDEGHNIAKKIIKE